MSTAVVSRLVAAGFMIVACWLVALYVAPASDGTDDPAIVACQSNDAYTPDLFGQCLDDWHDAYNEGGTP